MSSAEPTPRQRKILEFIDETIKENGFPPTVREIGKAVGLNSPATVHTHLSTLQDRGYIRRDPTKPRAIEVHWDAGSGWSQVTRDAAASTSGATSIQEDLSNSLKIYPNPVNQIANINFNADNSTQTTLEVLNSIGQVVKFNNYGILDGEQNLTVNMNDLPSGYYFVNIKTGNKLYNSRITVNN